MNLSGVIVKHKQFGKGLVKWNDEKLVKVAFPHGECMFEYPDAFSCFLTILDAATATAVGEEIAQKKKLAQEILKAEHEKEQQNAKQYSDNRSHRKSNEDNATCNIYEGFSLVGTNCTGLIEDDRKTHFDIKNKNESEYKKIIEKRRIEHLIHFTRIENLQSILKNGLVPLRRQQEMKLSSIRNDSQRIDFMPDCTSCSVEFPNYKLFFKFRNDNENKGAKWVILKLKKDILFSPANLAYYCYTNAASLVPKSSTKTKELLTSAAFESMFRTSLVTRDNTCIQRADLQIEDHYTTDPQAEILIRDIIDKKYISSICFQYPKDKNSCVLEYGYDVLKLFNCEITPELFSPRKDYGFWTKEKK